MPENSLPDVDETALDPTPAHSPAPAAPVDEAEAVDASEPAEPVHAVPGLSPAACAARLAELFPAVFSPGAPKPLKLRIQVDIQARAPGVFTKKVLSSFLQRHTTGTAYLKALLNQPQRIDLDGVPAGEVTDEHRQAATTELERRRALHDARRAAERDAQRQSEREHRESQRAAQNEARRAYEADEGARRERANLLHAFESSTLTRSNFCVLKRIVESTLDTQLTQARQEREQRAQAAPPQQHQPQPQPRPVQHERPPRPERSGGRPERGARPPQRPGPQRPR